MMTIELRIRNHKFPMLLYESDIPCTAEQFNCRL